MQKFEISCLWAMKSGDGLILYQEAQGICQSNGVIRLRKKVRKLASSGSFSGSIRDGHYAVRVDWTQTKNVSENTSTITCRIYLVNDWSLSISSRNIGVNHLDLTVGGNEFTRLRALVDLPGIRTNVDDVALVNIDDAIRRAADVYKRQVHPKFRSRSFVSEVESIQLFAVRQYDLRVLAHSQATLSSAPSFLSAANLVRTFFHCFQ